MDDCEASDEDVLPANSALTWYLKEIGYTSSDLLINDLKPPEVSDIHVQASGGNSTSSAEPTTMRSRHSVASSDSLFQFVESAAFFLFYRHVKQILLEFMESEDYSELDVIGSHKKLGYVSYLRLFSCFFVFFLTFYIGLRFMPSEFQVGNFAISAFYILLFVIFFVVLFYQRFILLFYYFRLLYNSYHLFKDFLKLLELLRKSVRLIQEKEVINRGFTFVAVPGIANSVNHSETVEGRFKERQCQSLRRLLFLQVRAFIHRIRAVTRHLTSELPHLQNFDGQERTLADIQDSEFGECFSVRDEDVLSECTDNFALPAIKSLNHLLVLHFSQIAKKVVIALHPFLARGLSLSTVSFVNGSILAMSSCLTGDLDEISLLYKLHTHKDVQCIGALKKALAEARNSSSDVLENSLHCLELHLESAMVRVRELKEVTCAASHENTPLSDCSYHLLRLREELSSVQICFDHFEKQLQVPSQLVKSQNVSRQKVAVQDAASVAVAVPCVDPVIEDEFLECLVDDDAKATDKEMCVGDNYEMDSQKYHLQVTKPVMSELRNVIRIKKREFDEREKAVRLKKGLPVNAASDEEEESYGLEKLSEEKKAESNNAARPYWSGTLEFNMQDEENNSSASPSGDVTNLRPDLASELSRFISSSQHLSFNEDVFGDSDSDI